MKLTDFSHHLTSNLSTLASQSLDLHVLGTPPAFILSQDQTLMFKILNLWVSH